MAKLQFSSKSSGASAPFKRTTYNARLINVLDIKSNAKGNGGSKLKFEIITDRALMDDSGSTMGKQLETGAYWLNDDGHHPKKGKFLIILNTLARAKGFENFEEAECETDNLKGAVVSVFVTKQLDSDGKETEYYQVDREGIYELSEGKELDEALEEYAVWKKWKESEEANDKSSGSDKSNKTKVSDEDSNERASVSKVTEEPKEERKSESSGTGKSTVDKKKRFAGFD